MKMQFDMEWKDLPPDPFNRQAWGKEGVYKTPQEPDKLYVVGSWSVDIIYSPKFFSEVEEADQSKVSESLLLKAIAAAAQAKVLA